MIAVSDWERSNRFYRDVFGAELVTRGSGWAYRFGAQQLNVHGPGVSADPVARIPVQPGNSDLCFVWDGPITDALAHLDERGVPIPTGRCSSSSPTRSAGARILRKKTPPRPLPAAGVARSPTAWFWFKR